jgi:hypothetical protein
MFSLATVSFNFEHPCIKNIEAIAIAATTNRDVRFNIEFNFTTVNITKIMA